MKKTLLSFSRLLCGLYTPRTGISVEENPSPYLSAQDTILLDAREQGFIGAQTPAALLRLRVQTRRQKRKGFIPGKNTYAVYGPFIQ